MKNLVALFIILVSYSALGQKEGQDFCGGDPQGTFFPLDVVKKKIFWYDTYYFETTEGTETINGVVYQKIKQQWKDDTEATLLLREQSGMILQYETCCPDEMVRYNSTYKQGESWLSRNNEKTTVVSYTEELKTPYCRYKNLMALKAEFKNVTYVFYYLRGYGYVGATKDGKLVSFVSPEW